MVSRKPKKKSNLFSIDFDAIEKVLEDANGPLIEKVTALLDNASELPEEINSNEAADEIVQLLKQLREVNREVSQARLADGRPFSDATKVVKNWFGRTENKLKALDKELAAKLAEYTNSVTAKLQEIRLNNIAKESSEFENQTNEHLIGQASDGMPIVQTNVHRNPENEIEQIEPQVPEVNMTWEVKSFNSNQLDLEQLRPFFTEHSLRLAINGHMRQHGANKLNGVIYEKVVSKKL